MATSFAILTSLQQLAPVNPAHRFLVAISGGVDSVVLAFLCKEAGLDIELLHCNFQLRGAESDRDEAFVRQLATSWNVPVAVNTVDLNAYAAAHNLSTQEAARQYRYAWFASHATTTGTTCWILTAHQADDNAETVAMNFFRGTGLSGLTGIPRRNGNVLRPLLSRWRHEIDALAREKGLAYVEDSSNANEKYTRNFFRHTVLPAIESVYPRVKENLVNSIERFTAIEGLYQHCVDRLRSALLVKKGKEYTISLRALRRYQGQALLFELFTPFGFTSGQLGEIQKLLSAQNGAQLQAASGPYRLIRNRNFLLLTGISTAATRAEIYLIESLPCTVAFEKGALQFTEQVATQAQPPGASQLAWLDASEIVFPLLLRRCRPGDYFYPLGMRKKKKLSRFFIDHKLSLSEKENTWVIESAARILWVVGMRIDDRFKVTNTTRRIVAINLTSAV